MNHLPIKLIFLFLFKLANSQNNLCLNQTTINSMPGMFLHYADFNNDGGMDAFAFQNGFIHISINNNIGGFNPVTTFSYNVNFFAKPIDVNLDGNVDIIYTDTINSKVEIIYGNGIASFTGSSSINAGLKPWHLVVNDFNNDGKNDIATINKGTSQFTLLKGNNSGGYNMPLTVSCLNPLKNIYSADFNNDGNKDIIVTYLNSNLISTYKGLGNGTFSLVSNFNSAFTVDNIEINDFNGDLKFDLAISSTSTSSFAIINGTGSGSFTLSNSYNLYATVIESGDINSDNKPDLIISDYFNVKLLFLLSSTSPNLSSPLSYTLGTSYIQSICSLAAGICSLGIFDINNDGLNDLLLTADNCGKLFGFTNCNTTFIEKEKITESILLYPNPAKDLLYVEVSHAERSRSVTSETPTSFSLTNALGQVIKEELLRELQQPIEINVKDLQEGIYFIQIKSEGKILVNKKFVIER